jgi:multiple sugar transport system permease protein
MKKKQIRLNQLVKSATAILIVVAILFPLLWLFFSSFKTSLEVRELPIRWLPQEATFDPLFNFFFTDDSSNGWLQYFCNTVYVTFTTTLAVMTIGTVAGYGLSRFKLPGTGLMLMVFLIAQLFTGPALMIPVYVTVAAVGLYDTLTGLSIVYIIFQIPFVVWISYSNFQTIPIELEEAAVVDGCTPLGAFFKVTLPLSRISLVTVGVMSFLLTWSEYPLAVVLLEKSSNATVSLGLAKYITAFNIYWNQMAAASLIISLPLLIFLRYAQTYFVKGLTAGAVKG